MPAFGERLGPEDIEAPTAPRTRVAHTCKFNSQRTCEDVANYVIDQAYKGWS